MCPPQIQLDTPGKVPAEIDQTDTRKDYKYIVYKPNGKFISFPLFSILLMTMCQFDSLTLIFNALTI